MTVFASSELIEMDAGKESATAVKSGLSDDDLWLAYRQDGSAEAREALFLRYMSFARRTALSILRANDIRHAELADVYQSAYSGLLQALDKFDCDRGVDFKTFATYRVRGAVMNDLTHSSEVQQQINARARQRTARLESLRPDDVSTTSPFDRIVDALAEVSIGLAVGIMLEDVGVYRDPDTPVQVEESAYETLAWKQARAALHERVARLPGNYGKVLAYHYFQGLNFEAVAEVMELSRGRISQLHRQALAYLRQEICQGGAYSTSV